MTGSAFERAEGLPIAVLRLAELQAPVLCAQDAVEAAHNDGRIRPVRGLQTGATAEYRSAGRDRRLPHSCGRSNSRERGGVAVHRHQLAPRPQRSRNENCTKDTCPLAPSSDRLVPNWSRCPQRWKTACKQQRWIRPVKAATRVRIPFGGIRLAARSAGRKLG